MADYKYDGYDEEELALPQQRNFFIRSYSSADSILAVLRNKYFAGIKHAHLIVHNNDVVKGPHCHLVLVTVGPTNVRAVHGWFKTCVDDNNLYGNTYVQIARDTISCYQYLIHANDKDKEQYDPLLIQHIGDPRPCMKAIQLIPEYDSVMRAWNEYKNGAEVNYLVNKYGREFLYHITAFDKAKGNAMATDNLRAQINDLTRLLDRLEGLAHEFCRFSMCYIDLSGDRLFLRAEQKKLYDLIDEFLNYFGGIDNENSKL